MRLLHIITLMLTLSCGTFRPPEHRGLPTYGKSNVVPELIVQPLLLKGRFPASTQTFDQFKNTKNKELYFMATYAQYNEYLKLGFFPKKPLKYCPHLHETFLNIKKTPSVHLSSDKTLASYNINSVNEGPGLFPELHLPIELNSPHPNVLDSWRETKGPTPPLKQGINIAIQKLENELHELCETGSSDNYFIVENLVSYMGRSNSSDREKTIKRLLKTSLFVNFSIINALAKRNKLSVDKQYGIYHTELLQRLNTSWAIVYFQRLNENIRLTEIPSNGQD